MAPTEDEIREAVRRLQAELTRNAPAIARILEEADDLPVARGLRVVNPETGRTVVGPETGHTVEIVPDDQIDRGVGYSATQVTVRIRPSFRPGLDYDLGSYPQNWVHDVADDVACPVCDEASVVDEDGCCIHCGAARYDVADLAEPAVVRCEICEEDAYVGGSGPAEMHDPDNPEDGRIVHADCGLARGWVVS